MSTKYSLFLDESVCHLPIRGSSSPSYSYFCMAGIIIPDFELPLLQTAIDTLKRRTWGDVTNPEAIILHQMRISEASKGRLDAQKFPEYVRFSNNATRRDFYRGLRQVFATTSIKIVGSCLSLYDLEQFYKISYKNKPDPYLVAMQFLLENYVHFLCLNNGIGSVIYETRNMISDEQLRDKYYQVKLMGSLYMTKQTTAGRLLGLDFACKSKNIAALQLADFVPNAFARSYAGLQPPRYNIFSTLNFHLYDGGVGDKVRYGIKNMP